SPPNLNASASWFSLGRVPKRALKRAPNLGLMLKHAGTCQHVDSTVTLRNASQVACRWMKMKPRFRLIYRGDRGSTFYCVDSKTGERFSLRTKVRDTAEQIVLAKNQALRQPALNLQIAKAYLAGTDSGVATRTWQHALEALIQTKLDSTKERWLRAAKD